MLIISLNPLICGEFYIAAFAPYILLLLVWHTAFNIQFVETSTEPIVKKTFEEHDEVILIAITIAAAICGLYLLFVLLGVLIILFIKPGFIKQNKTTEKSEKKTWCQHSKKCFVGVVVVLCFYYPMLIDKLIILFLIKYLHLLNWKKKLQIRKYIIKPIISKDNTASATIVLSIAISFLLINRSVDKMYVYYDKLLYKRHELINLSPEQVDCLITGISGTVEIRSREEITKYVLGLRRLHTVYLKSPKPPLSTYHVDIVLKNSTDTLHVKAKAHQGSNKYVLEGIYASWFSSLAY